MYKCEECNLEFKTFQEKANHHRWKHLKYMFKNNETKNKNKKYFENKWNTFTVKCCKCKKEIEIKEYNVDKPKKERYYCSKNCANSHVRTKESKLKQSIRIKERIQKGENVGFINKNHNFCKKEKICYCNYCGKLIKNKIVKFCSAECLRNYKRKDMSSYHLYKLNCQFTFALNQYPDEFDFSLVKKYGWYKAKNHGNNLNGVSRDHMFSIKEGFIQDVDPKIISHPANCQLLRHEDNFHKKNSKCSLTLEELQKKINDWDKKYSPVSVKAPVLPLK